jgi:hypothetical protein
MTLFDLIFIAVFLVSVAVLLAAAVAAIRGHRPRALGLLRGLGGLIGVYLAVVIAVSIDSPRRSIPLKEPRCFDDWCVSVDRVDRTAAGADVSYAVTLRLSSRARTRAQRENGVSVYVVDEHGRRFEPEVNPKDAPFDVLLQPGEAVDATRRFLLPADVQGPGLVIAHERFPGIFIIGDDQSLFHKPSVIPFP